MQETPEFPRALKLSLDKAQKFYSDPKYLESDPILFPSRYTNSLDREIVSLFSALFAYGNVKAIQQFLAPLFLDLGDHPYLALAEKNRFFETAKKNIKYYRFQTQADNRLFLDIVSDIASETKQSKDNSPLFETYFLNEDGFDPIEGISLFQTIFTKKILSQTGKKQLSPGLKFLIGEPLSKSAKKRICLFLRWMVRDKFPDFGIYKKILPNQIPFPLDVHIQRLIGILGISERKTFGIKESILIRDYFKNFYPDDPLLYDFCLTRVGIIRKCRGIQVEEICSICEIREACRIGSATGN
ncbi:TIGR02757 family protein [Leptospira idonii]|uniref:TIGR02757 family protein n=1 Tax=Leptospira idonii TaxID=1193500 RepID=A0A4R9M0Y3_9LEPT|nr:TIGR02757 family protein [Leptospira idonii]TGN18378.1 TIGR02757 family protein [Leptospira idonii]